MFCSPYTRLRLSSFICLAESVKFSSQVSVLTLKNGSMSFKGLFLGKQIVVVVAALVGHDPEAINLSSGDKEMLFFLLKTHFCVTDLNWDIGVTAFLEIDFFS